MQREVLVEKGKTYEIEITGLGHNCEGVGRCENFTIFVPFALPGERVKVFITEVKRNYAKGKLTKLLKKSADRIEPKCPVYEQCGGCQLQHVSYAAQLRIKRRQVADALEHIGGLKNLTVYDMLSAPRPWNYRNKMQFPVSRQGGRVVIGCYAPLSHAIIPTENCFIQKKANNDIAREMRRIIERLHLSTYDEKTGRGLVRHIISRVGTGGESMVVLVINGDRLPQKEKVIREIRQSLPMVVSIMQNSNTKNTNVIFGSKTIKLWGKDTIQAKLGEFSFSISAQSFFQVNTHQAEILYKKVVEFAALTGVETVIDAYCGTGTITLFLAKQAKQVYGIELSAQAIEDAKKNAAANRIANAKFIAADAVEAMTRLYKDGIKPDAIIADPPRCGCDKKVLQTFARMQPKRIVYVSCNPASLARDAAILGEFGYRVEELQPVDMFGQTKHVECVVLMSRVEK